MFISFVHSVSLFHSRVYVCALIQITEQRDIWTGMFTSTDFTTVSGLKRGGRVARGASHCNPTHEEGTHVVPLFLYLMHICLRALSSVCATAQSWRSMLQSHDTGHSLPVDESRISQPPPWSSDCA